MPFMSDGFTARKIATIPQDPYTREFLREVDMQTRVDIEEKFGAIIDYEWHCNTIANITVESLIQALAVDMRANHAPRASINFYDVFGIRVSTKKDAKAEKEGNINVSFEPGHNAEALIGTDLKKSDTPVEKVKPVDYYRIEDPDMDPDALNAMNQAYMNIDRKARYSLSNTYGIAIPDQHSMLAFAITDVFFMNIFRKLLYSLGESEDKELVSVNFNDNIEIHALRKDGGVILAMRPGMNAKLIIKSDETTEDEDDDLTPWYNE